MTGSRVVFDTWAWWEVLRGSDRGERLKAKYLDSSRTRVFTSALSLGELASKLIAEGNAVEVQPVASSIRGASDIVDVTAEIAMAGGALRAHLRVRAPDTSLADGIVLGTARLLGATLISADRAFQGLADVADR